MKTTVIALGFAVRIVGEVTDHNVAAAQQLGVLRAQARVSAWVVIADLTLRDPLILVYDFPLVVLVFVSIEDTLGRDLLGIFSWIFQAGRRR